MRQRRARSIWNIPEPAGRRGQRAEPGALGTLSRAGGLGGTKAGIVSGLGGSSGEGWGGRGGGGGMSSICLVGSVLLAVERVRLGLKPSSSRGTEDERQRDRETD
ncbi:hypothetical protein MARPO_0052s0015 [Marchantia polymorpha]|uniref:Uncharacterized protein n=1 Tax=Marchantia polymorpha TaxID=3197 RepID=A0A2R6WWH8_MARPO|nr:hypothetical protein MARPO_0052s0015 [Marchantia polymorpha]|eukprot:PTQ38211.1 hypothetical protein MARPO_0052s0015 [Marchantia polymorpha]